MIPATPPMVTGFQISFAFIVVDVLIGLRMQISANFTKQPNFKRDNPRNGGIKV
jgi:hypothetical protein